MKPVGIILVLMGIVAAALVIAQISSDDSQTQSASAGTKAATSVALDYSKPVFTRYGAVVCPQSLLFDMRADHSPYKVIDMFNSIWSRSDKAKELGCEELRDGIPVSATPLQAGLASVTLPEGAGGNLFTIESELTNSVPGQSDDTKRELAEPHINMPPGGIAPPLDDGITGNGLGSTLVSMASRQPILTGTGSAAHDSEGFGAVICPNTNTMGLFWDSYASHKGALELDRLKPYGCSYVPPGTPLISEGANSQNSLAVVTATLPDGTTIHGVTFPSMFVRSQVQPVQPPASVSDPSSSSQQQEANPN